MTDDWDFGNSGDWIKRTAQQTSDVLRKWHADDEERMAVMLERSVGVAVFDNAPNDLIFFACVFARLRREPLNETSKRELRLLLEDSKRWGH